MATRALSRQQLPVLTGDGSDGFPSEVEFGEQMEEYLAGLNPKKRAKALMSREMYATILAVLLDPHSTAHATAQFRFWAKRMFRLVVTPTANLVAHENRPVAVKDQIYAILVGTHGDVNHGGRDKTSAQVRRFYSWLPKELVSRFVKMCPTCIAKRRQQQPYLSDAYLPANFGITTRRVQINHVQQSESDPSSPDDAQEYVEQAGPSQPSQPALSQPPVYLEHDDHAYAYDASRVYDQGGQETAYEYHAQAIPQTDSTFVDGGYSYPMYYGDSYESAEAELPQPPATLYPLPALHAPAPPADDFLQDDQCKPYAYATTTCASTEPQQDHYFETYSTWPLQPSLEPEPAQSCFQYEGTEAATSEQYSQPPEIVEPQPQYPAVTGWTVEEVNQPKVVTEPSASSSLYGFDLQPTSFTPSTSARRAKPPPLDLGKSSNLYPSSLDPAVRRSATTGVPRLLSPSYQPGGSSSGLRSAPLQRTATSYGQYREPQISPGLASACSTASASTAFSSASSLPLTPGTSVSSVDSVGICALAPNVDGAWQDPAQIDEAIRLLLDSTSLKLPSTMDPTHAPSLFADPLHAPHPLYDEPFSLEGVELTDAFFQLIPPTSATQPSFDPAPQPSPTPRRRASQQEQHERPRLRTASSRQRLGLGEAGEAEFFTTPTKSRERRTASAAAASSTSAGGSGMMRTPTKEALRYMPY
ncbi:hypothetical protein JCM10207_000145 [Rhodosporidiobolus poonsookiae]